MDFSGHNKVSKNFGLLLSDLFGKLKVENCLAKNVCLLLLVATVVTATALMFAETSKTTKIKSWE